VQAARLEKERRDAALKRLLRNQERRSAASVNFALYPGLTSGANTTSPLRG